MATASNIIGYGVVGSRPTASAAITGNLYFGTDTGLLYRCNGSGWDSIANYAATPGTVTSVAASVPTGFSVAGSPITTTGTLAITESTQSANRIKAGPTSGGAAIPAYRALVQADMPAASGAGTGVVLAGPSLPGGPSDGQTYTKTVDGKTYIYNNSRGVWLGPEYELTIQGGYVPLAGAGIAGAVLLPSANAVLVTSWEVLTNDTNSDVVPGDYWTFTLVRILADASSLTVATLDTSLDPAATAAAFMHSTTTFTNNPTVIGDNTLSVNVNMTGGPDPVLPIMRILARDALAP